MLKRRWLPCPFTNTPELERWLAEQASQGLFLDSAGVLSGAMLFQRGEPRRLVYRILPREKSDFRSGDQLDAAYADQGWHYVCCLRRLFAVFAAEADAPPLPAPEARAERHVRNSLMSQPLCFVIIAAIWLLRTATLDIAELWRDISLLERLAVGLPLALLLGLAMALLLMESLGTLHALLVWQRVTAGRPVPPHPLAARLRDSLRLAALVLFPLALLSILISGTGRTYIPVSRTRAVLPLVTLDLLETKPVYYAPDESGPSILVSRRFSPLVAEDIQIKSIGMHDPDTDWRTTDYTSFPDASLTFSYYRLRTAALAGRVAQDELLRTCDWVEPQQVPGFETACTSLLESGEQYLCARTGDVVVTVRYRGSGDLTTHLEDIQAITAAYRSR